jgi:hypothetical protein
MRCVGSTGTHIKRPDCPIPWAVGQRIQSRSQRARSLHSSIMDIASHHSGTQEDISVGCDSPSTPANTPDTKEEEVRI